MAILAALWLLKINKDILKRLPGLMCGKYCLWTSSTGLLYMWRSDWNGLKDKKIICLFFPMIGKFGYIAIFGCWKSMMNIYHKVESTCGTVQALCRSVGQEFFILWEELLSLSHMKDCKYFQTRFLRHENHINERKACTVHIIKIYTICQEMTR